MRLTAFIPRMVSTSIRSRWQPGASSLLLRTLSWQIGFLPRTLKLYLRTYFIYFHLNTIIISAPLVSPHRLDILPIIAVRISGLGRNNMLQITDLSWLHPLSIAFILLFVFVLLMLAICWTLIQKDRERLLHLHGFRHQIWIFRVLGVHVLITFICFYRIKYIICSVPCHLTFLLILHMLTIGKARIFFHWFSFGFWAISAFK